MKPAACPDCGGELDLIFGQAFKDIAHMVVGGEWASLEPFPVELRCTACTFRQAGTGREFTVDIESGVVLMGKIESSNSKES